MRVAAAVVGPVLLITALTWPLLFTSAHFNTDWLMHLWYLWHESLAIRANDLPSLFIHYSHSVFYPEYAFYGGTLYALAGALSLLLGDAPLTTYILTYCISFTAAYGGWYWLARSAGVGYWPSHIPGFIFVTSASYITTLYGRGDWQEFVGVSTIPLMVAAGLSVLRADHLRFLPALALAGTGIVFFGGHNMTMLWGTTFLMLVGLAVIIWIPQARKELRWRGVIHVAILLIPAALANAWFLLPAIAYESHTLIGSGFQYGFRYWHDILIKHMPLVAAGRLFTLSRAASRGPEEANLVFSLPVPAMAWVLAGSVILVRAGSRGAWLRILAILCSATTVVLVLMTHASLILMLPRPYTILQYSTRLESYALLGLSGALLAVLALAKRQSGPPIKLWFWMLLPVLLIAMLGALQQLGNLPHDGTRESILSSSLEPLPAGSSAPLELEDYNDIALTPLVNTEKQPASIYFPPTAVHNDRTSMVVHLRAGQLVASNVDAGPELVHVSGAKIVGLDPEGNDVLQIDRAAHGTAQTGSRQAETISLSTARSLPVVLGRLLSLIAVGFLVVVFAALGARRLMYARNFPRASGRRSFLARGGCRRGGSSRRSSRS
jgi:hypothetical protein